MTAYLDQNGQILPPRFVNSDGIRFHHLRTGTGPTVVLIAGFPQSVYAWRRVIPLLAKDFDVIALDLPGQGDSDKPIGGYDTATAAKRVNAFIKTIGVGRHFLVGHDVGSWVGYPYAHEFASDLDGIVFLDANIPGVALQPYINVAEPDYWRNWHFLFNIIEDLPEALLKALEESSPAEFCTMFRIEGGAENRSSQFAGPRRLNPLDTAVPRDLLPVSFAMR